MLTKEARVLARGAELDKRLEQFSQVIGQDADFLALFQEAKSELKEGNILIAELCMALMDEDLKGGN